ncbi:MAG: hypothetical protein M1830_005272, partial [Pleopsidium flavum]
MTYAIDTTKRKFHRILDSLTNTSSTSLSTNRQNSNVSTTTLPINLESPPKKPRIARPASAYVRASSRSHTDDATRSHIAGKKSTPGEVVEDRRPPNFVPLDRGQFLARLKTFRHVDKWTSKPARVNEVQWAKRGWSCVGKERVGCVGGCGKELVIKLERMEEDTKEATENELEYDDWSASVNEQLVERYAEMIVTAHDDYCLWRKRGCDATIFRLPLSHPATALSALRQRYASLSVMASDLPSSLSTPSTVDTSSITEELGTDFFRDTQADPGDFSLESASCPAINEQALALTLFGWQAEDGHISGLA